VPSDRALDTKHARNRATANVITPNLRINNEKSGRRIKYYWKKVPKQIMFDKNTCGKKEIENIGVRFVI
jgi:hypothetical protein